MEVRPQHLAALAVSQTPRGPPPPAPGIGARPPAGAGGTAAWGRGVSLAAPALSDVIGPRLRGPRHLLSIPPGWSRGWSGPPLTSPPSLLPWAPHVWQQRRPGRPEGAPASSGRGADRSLAARPAARLPGRAPAPLGAARRSPRGADCGGRASWLPLGQWNSGDLAPGPEEAEARKRGRAALSLPLSGAHGARRHRSSASPRDRARDARPLSRDRGRVPLGPG